MVRVAATSLGTVATVNSIWLTIAVALLSVAGALGGQWIAGIRAYRLAKLERDARWRERSHQSRQAAYQRFLAAARAIPSVARAASDSSTTEPAMAALRDAAGDIDLQAPDLADGSAQAVLDAAQRLLTLVSHNSPESPAVAEAESEYDEAFRTLRAEMRDDLNIDPWVV